MTWILDPIKNKNKLSDAGLFLLAYEILRASIVDGVKDFYIEGFDEKGMLYSKSYKTKVLNKADYPYKASLLWLLESEAIDEDDVKLAEGIRDYRHKVAHELTDLLFTEDREIDSEMLKRASILVRKIDNFWANVDIDIDPDLHGDNVDRENAVSVRSLLLDYIIQTVHTHSSNDENDNK